MPLGDRFVVPPCKAAVSVHDERDMIRDWTSEKCKYNNSLYYRVEPCSQESKDVDEVKSHDMHIVLSLDLTMSTAVPSAVRSRFFVHPFGDC
jgi:hypothetical protein